MSAWSAAALARLAAFISERAGARTVRVEVIERLVGGAIQENWALAVAVDGGALDGRHDWVLRTTAPTGVPASRPQGQEFALLQAAHGAGVRVPAPLWRSDSDAVIGRPFYLMQRLQGTAVASRVVKAVADAQVEDGRAGAALADQLGRELAKIHTITPPRADLAFLGLPRESPAADAIAEYRAYLDDHGDPHPALEWGLRWLARHAPPAGDVVLVHRDYRTGNFMLGMDGGARGSLVGILDWEFAGWGDPLEDIGWFCAKCWRFGAADLEAGGIAARAPFYAAYDAASGRQIDRDAVRYWEVMAHVRWAIIALQQGERYLSGAQPDLELALIGRRPAELEYEILAMTGIA